MTDRLKQLSLRKFRDTIADVHEVVEVSRRDPQGNIQILGFWTPYVTYPEGSKPLPALDSTGTPTATVSVGDPGGQTIVPLEIPVDEEPVPRVIRTPEQAAVAVVPDPVRAVPKPSQQRKRR